MFSWLCVCTALFLFKDIAQNSTLLHFVDLSFESKEIVKLSGLVHIHLDQSSSLSQSQTTVFVTLIDKSGTELQEGLWQNAGSRTELKHENSVHLMYLVVMQC